jgi:hypothetical protein
VDTGSAHTALDVQKVTIMKKQKVYRRTRFTAEVLGQAYQSLRSAVGDEPYLSRTLYVETDEAKWNHDNEAEFFADYRRSTGTAYFWHTYSKAAAGLEVTAQLGYTEVSISAPDRSTIEAVFAIFEAALSASMVPEPPPAPKKKPTVFIGHGGSTLWRDLKDHLQDQHGYPVEAYETGSRAGHAVRDVLEEMLNKSSFAILVMTGEDETASGELRARQNVVHEAGLFQGKLGFNRAIALVENGVETFSNISGIQQIRFEVGQIRATFGDVLATLKREFDAEDV